MVIRYTDTQVPTSERPTITATCQYPRPAHSHADSETETGGTCLEALVDDAGTGNSYTVDEITLSLAARLLCNEHTSLTRIAEVIGYESQPAFSRAFRSEYGVAPGRWRRGITTQRQR